MADPTPIPGEYVQIIVLGNNAASVFTYAMEIAQRLGWNVEGQDHVARIVVSVSGPPIITIDPGPAKFWFSDLPEPTSPAKRKLIYAMFDGVNIYTTTSASKEPTPAQLFAPTTRKISKRGDDVQLWHAPHKDSTLLCVYDGVLDSPPNGVVMWVKGEQMQALPVT